ncbi:ankyrin repeat-containing protein BDA1-like [Cornus florida]|uniref:ankyrin repeat-containing protein BDA1-like n=1 Tax=Cornus florida TaxID=4283 RepID=UPI00289EE80E|nr:ankyrin repeat-containing protein BDA1-like [Cornus florida]
MDCRLKEVAERGDINALYSLFRQCKDINALYSSQKSSQAVDEDDNERFRLADTPLHVAASMGHTHFAVEMIKLMPSFGRKLNPDGYSPLHLILRNGHAETVIRLININSDLIRVQGKEGITPLHYVAEKNDVTLLAEFLCACPASVQDLNVRGETAVHVAVRNCSLEAFKVHFNWANKTDVELVLKLKDEDGNKALHVAAYTNQREVVKLLLKTVGRGVIEKNMLGLTAHDLTSDEEIRKMFTRASRSCTNYNSACIPYSTDLAHFINTKGLPNMGNIKRLKSSDLRNTLLVVATLVATATYQVSVAPPTGIFDDGKKLAVPEFYYYTLLFINSTAFAASVMLIFITLEIGRHFLVLRLSLFCIVSSYILNVLSTTPKTPADYVTVLLPFLSYLVSIYFYCRERIIFIKMPIGRYNPSHYFQLRDKLLVAGMPYTQSDDLASA